MFSLALFFSGLFFSALFAAPMASMRNKSAFVVGLDLSTSAQALCYYKKP
jgi:hypothetical protein